MQLAKPAPLRLLAKLVRIYSHIHCYSLIPDENVEIFNALYPNSVFGTYVNLPERSLSSIAEELTAKATTVRKTNSRSLVTLKTQTTARGEAGLVSLSATPQSLFSLLDLYCSALGLQCESKHAKNEITDHTLFVETMATKNATLPKYYDVPSNFADQCNADVKLLFSEVVSSFLELMTGEYAEMRPNECKDFNSSCSTPPSITVKDYLIRITKYIPGSIEQYCVALIYLDRLLLMHQDLRLTPRNVHRILMTSFLLQQKFTDDVFFTNTFFASVGGVPSSELNNFELRYLLSINFYTHVNTPQIKHYQSRLCAFMQHWQEEKLQKDKLKKEQKNTNPLNEEKNENHTPFQGIRSLVLQNISLAHDAVLQFFTSPLDTESSMPSRRIRNLFNSNGITIMLERYNFLKNQSIGTTYIDNSSDGAQAARILYKVYRMLEEVSLALKETPSPALAVPNIQPQFASPHRERPRTRRERPMSAPMYENELHDSGDQNSIL